MSEIPVRRAAYVPFCVGDAAVELPDPVVRFRRTTDGVTLSVEGTDSTLPSGWTDWLELELSHDQALALAAALGRRATHSDGRSRPRAGRRAAPLIA